MTTSGKSEMVPVSEIQLDRSNPRIQKILEMYDKPTPDQVFLALGAGVDKETVGQDGTTFEKLKQSIITSGGIIQPVILNRSKDDSLICIEGNTRVALYQDFLKQGMKGSWNKIPAIVHDEIDDNEMHGIRLQAHLVGPRPWDPYSKAKYLYELRHKNILPFAKIVDFCGGNQIEVTRYINAYRDMEDYYRPILSDDSAFDITRFSGFVELQKPGIKHHLSRAGYDVEDFSAWIRDNKMNPLNTVRLLPRILQNPQAHKEFLENGAKAAEMCLEKPKIKKDLQDADLVILAHALKRKIEDLPFAEYQKLRDDLTGDKVEALLDVQSSLSELLSNLA